VRFGSGPKPHSGLLHELFGGSSEKTITTKDNPSGEMLKSLRRRDIVAAAAEAERSADSVWLAICFV